MLIISQILLALLPLLVVVMLILMPLLPSLLALLALLVPLLPSLLPLLPFLYLLISNIVVIYYLLNYFFFIFFFVSISADANRVPYDLPEAESEPVAGFITEYSTIYSSIILLSEYSNIIGLSYSSILVFSINAISLLLFLYFVCLIRSSMNRLKFDELMTSARLVILPIIFIFLLYLIIIANEKIKIAPIMLIISAILLALSKILILILALSPILMLVVLIPLNQYINVFILLFFFTCNIANFNGSNNKDNGIFDAANNNDNITSTNAANNGTNDGANDANISTTSTINTNNSANNINILI